MVIIREGTPVVSTIVTADRIWAADGQGIRHRAFVQFEGDTITTVGNQADLPHNGETVDARRCDTHARPHQLPLPSNALLRPEPAADYFSMTDELFMALAIKHARGGALAGVTTLRDCGTKNNIVFSVRTAQEMGLIDSPRIWASGACLTSTGGHCYFFGVEVDGETEIKQAVRAQVKAGADFIKVMATGGGITPGTNPRREQFSEAEMVTLVNDAHRLNRRVSAHCHGTPGVINATVAHVDTIEHCSFMVEESPGIKYEPEVVAQIAERGIYVVPTTSVGYRMLEKVLRGEIPRTPQRRGSSPTSRRAWQTSAALSPRACASPPAPTRASAAPISMTSRSMSNCSSPPPPDSRRKPPSTPRPPPPPMPWAG